ncbi:MAG: creatininase family protein [Nitrososphaeria archaeon]|nr:creatininase family protein [Nitrososphaeria archaeon]
MTEIRELADPAIRKINSKSAIIPVGSLEQHGPHLPISTDSDIVTAVAQKIAKKCGLLLLPTIQYGVSFEHAPFVNFSIKDKTLQNYLVDLCVSLGQNKINKIIILNGHHGNQNALKSISGKIAKTTRNKTKVFVFSYWRFMDREFDHAGFVETSLMMAISNKTNLGLAKKGLSTENMTPQQRQKISKLASKQFIKATKNGVWGDPTIATKKDGQKIFAEITQNLVKTVSKLIH